MNYNANVLLAPAAAPVMAHAQEEVEEMAGIAQAPMKRHPRFQ
jgi:hydroxyethylthiazole kinase